MDTITGSLKGQLLNTNVRVRYKVHRGDLPVHQSCFLVTLHGVVTLEHPPWSLAPS